MGNTRILTHEFDYLVPTNLKQALKMLSDHTDASLVAGGTDLIPAIKYQVTSPQVIINLMCLSELDYVKREKGLRIGATAKMRRIEQFCRPLTEYRCLYEALYSIGKVQVMNMATMAGNICTASPAGDSAPALLVLGASVKLSSLEGEREVSIDDFFVGPRLTVRTENEIMTEIAVPEQGPSSGSAFSKMTRVGSDISKITCAVSVNRQNGTCRTCKIAMGAVAPTPVRLPRAEKIISGVTVEEQIIEEVARQVTVDIQPQTDVRSTEAYRRQVAANLFKTTFKLAWEQAEGSE